MAAVQVAKNTANLKRQTDIKFSLFFSLFLTLSLSWEEGRREFLGDNFCLFTLK